MYLIRRQIYIIISITEQLPIIFIMENLTWGSRILEGGRENVEDTKNARHPYKCRAVRYCDDKISSAAFRGAAVRAYQAAFLIL